MTERHCVVLAGGLGTRIREVTRGLIPKVLVPVLGKPFLHYKLTSLREMGVTGVTLLVGELGDLIDEFVAKRPNDGMVCRTIHDGSRLLGTAGSIARALPYLPEVFWVTYGDTYVVADLPRAEREMHDRGLSSVMTVLHNSDALEVSNTHVEDGLVLEYKKGVSPGTFEWIDYGLLHMKYEHFVAIPNNTHCDLYEVLTALIPQKQMIAFEVTERFWDVGTPEALQETESEFRRRGLR